MIERLLGLLAVIAATAAQAATDAPDGTLLSSEPCPPNPITSYEEYLETVRAYSDREAESARAENIEMPAIGEERLRAALLSRLQVDDHIAYRGFECHVIAYASGGLKIAGLLWKPKDTAGKRLPLLIVLRGGNNTFGPMQPYVSHSARTGTANIPSPKLAVVSPS